MAVSTSIAIYFLIWWTALFAVLPWGIRSQVESGKVVPGSDPGAPAIPGLKVKLIWTTIIATATYVAFHVTYVYRLVTLDDLATLFGLLR